MENKNKRKQNEPVAQSRVKHIFLYARSYNPTKNSFSSFKGKMHINKTKIVNIFNEP